MRRRRLEMLQDCLAILSEADLDDASLVIEVLGRMRISGDLKAMWRPMELPATARANVAEEHES